MTTATAPTRIHPSTARGHRLADSPPLLTTALTLLGQALLRAAQQYQIACTALVDHEEPRRDLQALAHSGIMLPTDATPIRR